MHILALTAASGVADADLIAVCGALGLQTAHRHDDRAAEARLDPARFTDRAAVLKTARMALADRPVDVNIVEAGGRRKRLLLADMDSTIIGCECVDEIADFVGVKPEVAAITERAMQGDIAFEAALRERVALLAGLPVAKLEEVYQQRVRLNPGAEVMVRTMAAAGAATALVSGGFTFFADRVAAAAGFGQARANVLVDRDGVLTGEVAAPILGADAKLAALNEISAQIGAAPSQALAVGDGANDLPMLRAAGLGVAYRAKPVVAAEAKARLDHSDLTALLSLQGVPASDFVQV